MTWLLKHQYDHTADGNASSVIVNDLDCSELLIKIVGVGMSEATSIGLRLGSDNATVDNGSSAYKNGYFNQSAEQALSLGSSVPLGSAVAASGHEVVVTVRLLNMLAQTQIAADCLGPAVRRRTARRVKQEAENIVEIFPYSGEITAGRIQIFCR